MIDDPSNADASRTKREPKGAQFNNTQFNTDQLGTEQLGSEPSGGELSDSELVSTAPLGGTLLSTGLVSAGLLGTGLLSTGPLSAGQPGFAPDQIGVIVVDHGSRRAASNEMLLEVVRLFEQLTSFPIVEPAHMELAEPSIATAFDRCVERGARLVVVHPYFLLPGRHWDQDIPALAAAAAKQHPEAKYLVTAPLGLHPLMVQIMHERIQHCLSHTLAAGQECDACSGTGKCRIDQASPAP